MLHFKQWLNESKFTEITPKQNKAIDEIAKEILGLFSKLQDLSALADEEKQKIFDSKAKGLSKYIANNGPIWIGSIPFEDTIIPVKLTNKPGTATYEYSEKHIAFNIFYLVKNELIDINKLKRTLYHELGHAIDPKYAPGSQHKTSKRYNDYLTNSFYKAYKEKGQDAKIEHEPIHHVEPVERDANGTEIANILMKKFKNAKAEGKLEILKDIEQYLKYNWLNNYDTFDTRTRWHIHNLKTRPTEYRRFKVRLDNLYQKMKSMLRLPKKMKMQ